MKVYYSKVEYTECGYLKESGQKRKKERGNIFFV